MFLRFGLMIAVNIGVMVSIYIIMSLLGFQHSARTLGGPLSADYFVELTVFSLLWGFFGAFISLMISKFIAKKTMGLRIIEPDSCRTPSERSLIDMVNRSAQLAQLPKMPEVAVYDSPEVNAFATGPSRSNSLVAFSQGLLNGMTPDEIEGVVAHEVSHIANGDMVTMTLIQGIINSFVVFLSSVIAKVVASALNRDDNESPSYLIEMVLQTILYIAFGILGAMVVSWFSRQREFRADAGASKLVGANKMIAALLSLKNDENRLGDLLTQTQTEDSVAMLKISNGKHRFLSLFDSHPSLDSRIAALRSSSYADGIR